MVLIRIDAAHSVRRRARLVREVDEQVINLELAIEPTTESVLRINEGSFEGAWIVQSSTGDLVATSLAPIMAFARQKYYDEIEACVVESDGQ